MSNKRFNQRRDAQVWLEFPGVGNISTVWAWGSYSDNHMAALGQPVTQPQVLESTQVGTFFRQPISSDTVECMYETNNVKLQAKIRRKLGDDNPLGYLSFADWLWLVNAFHKAETTVTTTNVRHR